MLDGGRDDQLHYVFCYRRIAYLPKHDRRKAPAERLLSALLHPIDELYRGDSSAKFKLIRLRHLFSTIRLLSMLAIDSYYSAQPLRFQIAQSVLGLPDLMRSMSNEGTNIGNLLKQTAAWLADALYLAPEVTTLRSAHELRVAAEIKKRAKGPSKAKALRKLLDRSLWHGVTPVEKRGFRHLVRLTLRGAYQKRLLPEDKFLATAAIHRDVICGDSALASVDTNSFSGDSHIDLMVQGSSPTADNWGLLSRLITWAIKAIEVQALNELRRLVPGAVRADKKATKTVSTRFLTRLVRRHLSLVPQLFRAVMKELLPPGWSVEIEREGLLSEDSRTIRLRASLSIGVQIDELGEELTRQIEDNPHALSPAALQELVATRSALDRSPSKFIIGCVGKIVIKDQLGKHRDEVDGLFVEVDGDSIRVRMVEAKTGGTYQERETSAMNQLAATRSWVRRRKGLSCARRRLPRMGAMMIVSAVRSESTSK
ncbi:MAG: hypothetical protein ACPGJF_06140 [Sinimarinibacterium flocculans]|uniref:hypothetical protein n=1 Tax=Sinimarinibacterium flocculans TaxID=985250 RepID=UPI003C461D47